MADRVSISVPDSDEDLLEWVDNKVEEGVFRSRSHGFCYAVKHLRDAGKEEIPI